MVSRHPEFACNFVVVGCAFYVPLADTLFPSNFYDLSPSKFLNVYRVPQRIAQVHFMKSVSNDFLPSG